MRFEEAPLAGVWTIELERIADQRGWFARTFDEEEFRRRGLDPTVVQCNASFNERAGTLRGMHYQADPHGEPKLVRCVRGAIFDVAVDLRRESATFCGWHGVELSAENGRMLYIPSGLAHGFQTLTDDCEVLYTMGHRYVPEAGRGVRWDDPAFAIRWPAAPEGGRVISEKDLAYRDFEP
jgi:dTDP-4-dehydrorhamnose 3,5-epimerase